MHFTNEELDLLSNLLLADAGDNQELVAKLDYHKSMPGPEPETEKPMGSIIRLFYHGYA